MSVYALLPSIVTGQKMYTDASPEKLLSVGMTDANTNKQAKNMPTKTYSTESISNGRFLVSCAVSNYLCLFSLSLSRSLWLTVFHDETNNLLFNNLTLLRSVIHKYSLR